MRRGKRRLLADGGGAPPPELQPGGAFEGRPGEFALQKFNYYECGRCKEPYFGGDRAVAPAAAAAAAEAAAEEEETEEEEEEE